MIFPNVGFGQNSGDDITAEIRQTFKMFLEGDIPPGIRWAGIGDPVLDIREAADNLSATINTTGTGRAEIQIQDASREVIFWLAVDVSDSDEGAGFDVPAPVTEPIQ